MSKLVIVESPAKARKLKGWLPSEYVVEASVGHVRDLPAGDKEVPKKFKDAPGLKHGVLIENRFEPIYVVSDPRSKKVLADLKKKLKDADELILATDPDREGESISWHLKEELNPKVPVKRVVFNEITKRAVLNAFESPRDIDQDLVQAQETRRLLDRLYGYELSPLLWQKVSPGLSAGRVQSPAVRLIVERERARMKFKVSEYWDLTAVLSKDSTEFEAGLVTLGGKKVVNAKRFFDDETGALKEDPDVVLLDEADAHRLKTRILGKTWTVASVEESPRTSNPKPPFTTNTLLAEASSRLGMGTNAAMRAAQALYENGFITYHRTDSAALSREGLDGSRKAVVDAFGRDYLEPNERQAKSKGGSAQEAHEAIRPAGEQFVPPERTGLKGRDRDLYELIWKRTVAWQMKPEKYLTTTVHVDVEVSPVATGEQDESGGLVGDASFKATGKKVTFPGWRKAYGYDEDQDRILPELAEGDHPGCVRLEPVQHATSPPARYTEGSLVSALEELGIGRPSTYASIIESIQDRKYCNLEGKQLVPTFLGFVVTNLLERHFEDLVAVDFTAEMEEDLDKIAKGEKDWHEYLEKFWSGPEGLENQVKTHKDEIDPREINTLHLPQLEGMPVVVRVGRYGPYIEAPPEDGDEPVRATIPQDVTPDKLTPELVEELLKQAKEGPEALGKDPESGKPVYVRSGRFGAFVQLGEAEGKKKPPRASIPKAVTPSEITLDEALFLLKLPEELGPHPEGGAVARGLGRYGPYVVHFPDGDGKPDYRSLKSYDHLKSVTFEEALGILKEPKRGRGARGQQKVLKDLGAHPTDKQPVRVLDGRYGPYVKHGKTNASLPKDAKVEDVDMGKAVELLEARKKRKR